MSNSTYFVNGYPYSDTHNLNLDWIINKLKQIETQMGEITDGLEVHVKDDSGTEVYVFTVKSNGIYITRPDGGTPIYYNLATGQLHAPTFDGQSILTATARTTGQLRAGSLVLDTPLPITGGGTGATTATEARTALGAMASDAVIPITQGGTGATTAADARTALGAMASDAVIPVTQGGTGATTAGAALTALGGVPTTRTVNTKPLSSDVTLTASDVGAYPSSGGPVTGDVSVQHDGWPAFHFQSADGTRYASIIFAVNSKWFYFRLYHSNGTYSDYRFGSTWDMTSSETKDFVFQ